MRHDWRKGACLKSRPKPSILAGICEALLAARPGEPWALSALGSLEAEHLRDFARSEKHLLAAQAAEAAASEADAQPKRHAETLYRLARLYWLWGETQPAYRTERRFCNRRPVRSQLSRPALCGAHS